MNSLTFILLVLFLNPKSFSQSEPQSEQLDKRLRFYIQRFNLTSPDKLPPSRPALVSLGKQLYFEKLLSGNKNISCSTCHHPNAFSGDGLTLSIGEGGKGEGMYRQQVPADNGSFNGEIISRHSPALFNLGDPEVLELFWDGRVAYDPQKKAYQTPEKSINGADPAAKEIVSQLTGALSAQVLFPLLSPEEMRGKNGENELAGNMSNLQVWNKIIQRLLNNPQDYQTTQKYRKLFQEAFSPSEKEFYVDENEDENEDGNEESEGANSWKKYNIGHLGAALAAFISDFYFSRDTPYDQYLSGKLQAMTLKQKKGMEVFITNGRCIMCHFGPHLSNAQYMNVGVPHISPKINPTPSDDGRFNISGDFADRFKFRTPQLRNVGLTAPYMHNGAIATLEMVVEHYNDVSTNLNSFQQSYYPDLDLIVDRDRARNNERFNGIDFPFLKRGLFLTEVDKANLVIFLQEALTDNELKNKMINFPEF